MAYALAMWAACSSLLAVALFRRTHAVSGAVEEEEDALARTRAGGLATSQILLYSGWVVVVLAYLIGESSIYRRGKKKEARRGEGDELHEEGKEVAWGAWGREGIPKRWWDIRSIAAPPQQLVMSMLMRSAHVARLSLLALLVQQYKY
jgi:hypothetical protein